MKSTFCFLIALNSLPVFASALDLSKTSDISLQASANLVLADVSVASETESISCSKLADLIKGQNHVIDRSYNALAKLMDDNTRFLTEMGDAFARVEGSIQRITGISSKFYQSADVSSQVADAARLNSEEVGSRHRIINDHFDRCFTIKKD